MSRPSAPAPPRNVLAVLPFTVRGGQDAAYLREGLMDLLSVQLDRIGEVRTVDPHAVLGRAGGDREPLRPGRAGRLARQLGAGSYILGSVVEAGGEIQIQASLYGPGRSPERTARVRGRPQEDLFAMVDGLVRELLPALLPELDDPLDRSAVRTTGSMEALEAYLAGERAFRRGLYPEAADAFRTAVAADSAFSLAHYRLAVATEFSGGMDPEVFHHAIDRALRHALGLPWRERAFLEAFALYHRGRAVDAEARFNEILADYPEDVDALYGLAEVLLHAGPRTGRRDALAAARRAFEAVLELDPAHMESRLHLVRIAAAQADAATMATHLAALRAGSLEGRPIVESAEVLAAFISGDAGARREALRHLERQPAILVLIPAFFVATYAGDAEGAAGIAAVATAPSRPARQRAAAHILRAHLLASTGRLDEAELEIAAAAPLHPALARRHRGLLLAVPGLLLDTAGVDSLRLALAEPVEDEVMGPEDLRYVTLTPGMDRVFDLYVAGLLDAVAGDLEAAGSRVAALEALDASDPRLRDDLARGLRAEILRRRGRPGEALAVLEEIRYETWHQAAMGSPFHALARERSMRAALLGELGRADEAAAWRPTCRGTTPWDLVYGGVTPPATGYGICNRR